jgi:hypothetical protein
VGAGPARARRVPDLRHALVLRGAHRPPPDFLNASFWTSCPKGFAWADPRDSITISDLQTDNKLWNWGKISSPTKQNLRMNFHAFWRPELKAMGDVLADRIVGPRLSPGAAGDPVPEAGQAPSAPPPPPARPSAVPPPPPPTEG